MSSTRNTATEASIPLIDPTSKGGLVLVPMSKTHDTKGRTEYLRGLLKKDVSLCCLFQRGRCNAGDKCHQIHVDTDFMRAVREQQQHIVSCCRQCHDTYSVSGPAVSFFALHFPPATVHGVRLVLPPDSASEVELATAAVPVDRLAWTVGLQQFMENGHPHQPQQGVVYLPAKKACRLHLRGACKYGKDCKNIHLCSQLGEGYLANTSPTPSRHPRPHVPLRVAKPPVWGAGRSTSLPADSSASLFDRMSDEQSSHVRTNSAPPASPAPNVNTAVGAPVGDDGLEKSGLGPQGRAMQLCFDPLLLAEACADADATRRMSNAAVDWDNSFDGLSSTSSARSVAPLSTTSFFDCPNERQSRPWGHAAHW